MRTPDEDGSGTDAVSTTVGDGFGPVTGEDLEDGFGEDDFSDDNSFDDSFDDDTSETSDTSDSSDTSDADTPFGDGLSDAEAENVLVEILEDVFGADAPDVLDDVASDTAGGGADVFEALERSSDGDGSSLGDVLGDDGTGVVVDDPFDPFEPAEVPTESDFDFTGDGHVDGHDLHEAAHPFDFDVTE